MDECFKKDIFLEHCFLPAKIDGSKLSLKNIEILLVGITGLGSKQERNGQQSCWIHGEILSPNFIGNDNCSCRSHIEGIVTENGKMNILEAVYHFPAYEGDCFEYRLDVKDMSATPIEFMGEITSRLSQDNFRQVKVGQIYLNLNPFWVRFDSGQSINYSLPYNNRHFTNGIYIPKFWTTFLGKLEEQGYEHPYGAVSDKLKKERAEKNVRTKVSINTSDSEDIPF